MTRQQYDCPDGQAWLCCNSSCRKFKTIRDETPFKGLHYDLKKCIKTFALWAEGMPQCQITQFVGNKKQEATDLICQRLRQCAINWYEQDLTNNPLGSTGGVIQADETALGNAKYHKGSALKRECNWVVGGIDSLTGRMAVEQVQKRDADTLLRFLQRVCAPGATIYTDCWKSYNCLQDNGFPHQTVNHSVQFVNTLPDGTKVHTQKI